MVIKIFPWRVTRFLSLLAGCFILVYVVGELAVIYMGQPFELAMFDLSGKQSIPRFFSAIMQLFCAVILSLIVVAEKREYSRNYIYWLGLALIFLFLALTKSTSVHEEIARVTRSTLNISKIQFYAWAYGIAAVIIPLFYMKFFLSLPRQTSLLLVIGGISFMVGAFAFDLMVAYLGKLFSQQNLPHLIFATLEEAMELGGIMAIFHALLTYVSSEMKWIRVEITGS